MVHFNHYNEIGYWEVSLLNAIRLTYCLNEFVNKTMSVFTSRCNVWCNEIISQVVIRAADRIIVLDPSASSAMKIVWLIECSCCANALLWCVHSDPTHHLDNPKQNLGIVMLNFEYVLILLWWGGNNRS